MTRRAVASRLSSWLIGPLDRAAPAAVVTARRAGRPPSRRGGSRARAYGEARTRTGDTMIFRRAASPLKFGWFAGVLNGGGPPQTGQIFPDFERLFPTLRPTASLVGLFVT